MEAICQRVCLHVFGNCRWGNENQFLDVNYTRRFFRKCCLCEAKRSYSKMARCIRCEAYVHKECFLVDLCKEDDAKRTKVGSPRRADAKEFMDTSNVEVDDREEETHDCIIKRRKRSGSQNAKDLFKILKTRVRGSRATDMENAVDDGATTSARATSSDRLSVPSASVSPWRSSSKPSLVPSGVENNLVKNNPTPPAVVPNGPEVMRVDGKPRTNRRQQLYDVIATIAADRRGRSSVVTVAEGPVGRPVTASETRRRDACDSPEANGVQPLPSLDASARPLPLLHASPRPLPLLHASARLDVENAINEGATTSAGVTSSSRLPISSAPVSPWRSSSKPSLVPSGVENNQVKSNPTPSVVVPDGPEVRHVDGKPIADRRQQLYDEIAAIAADRRVRSSVVTVGEESVGHPVTANETQRRDSSETQRRDASAGLSSDSSKTNGARPLPLPHASTRPLPLLHASACLDVVEDDGRREVPFDVGSPVRVPVKTPFRRELVDPARPPRADDLAANAVRKALRIEEQQRLKGLFEWMAEIDSTKRNVVVDKRSSIDPPASNGRLEASDGRSGRVENDGVKSESSAREPGETPSSWIETIYNSAVANRTVEDETIVVGGTTNAEEKRSGELFARTIEVRPVESKPSECVVDVEAIGEDITTSDARLDDIPSVFESSDPAGTSSCASDSESIYSYHTALTGPALSTTGESDSNELLSTEETQRLSSPVERIMAAKRPKPASNETGPLCVIIKEGWIDRPFDVRKLNPRLTLSRRRL